MCLEFALEVPASLAGRRIRPVFKSGGHLFNSRLGVSLRLRFLLLYKQAPCPRTTEFTEFRCFSRGGVPAPRRDAAAIGRSGAAPAPRRRDADAATPMATRRRQRQLPFPLLSFSSPLPLLPSFPSLCARARERRWHYVARAADVGRLRRRQRQLTSHHHPPCH